MRYIDFVLISLAVLVINCVDITARANSLNVLVKQTGMPIECYWHHGTLSVVDGQGNPCFISFPMPFIDSSANISPTKCLVAGDQSGSVVVHNGCAGFSEVGVKANGFFLKADDLSEHTDYFIFFEYTAIGPVNVSVSPTEDFDQAAWYEYKISHDPLDRIVVFNDLKKEGIPNFRNKSGHAIMVSVSAQGFDKSLNACNLKINTDTVIENNPSTFNLLMEDGDNAPKIFNPPQSPILYTAFCHVSAIIPKGAGYSVVSDQDSSSMKITNWDELRIGGNN